MRLSSPFPSCAGGRSALDRRRTGLYLDPLPVPGTLVSDVAGSSCWRWRSRWRHGTGRQPDRQPLRPRAAGRARPRSPAEAQGIRSCMCAASLPGLAGALIATRAPSWHSSASWDRPPQLPAFHADAVRRGDRRHVFAGRHAVVGGVFINSFPPCGGLAWPVGPALPCC